MELYLILIFQIINILMSGCMPVVSNFLQTLTNSECCGMKIRREINKKSMRKNKPPEEIEEI